MPATKLKSEVITLPTFRSNGVKEELIRFLIERNVHISDEIRLKIMSSSNHPLVDSVTTDVDYHPVVIPVSFFVNQGISLCDDNKWYIPENTIYRQAKELGLRIPPVELAFLIAANPPSDHPELVGLRNLVIMSDPKSDMPQMTVSLTNVPGQTNTNTFLDTVWKNTFLEVRHIYAQESGLVFFRE